MSDKGYKEVKVHSLSEIDSHRRHESPTPREKVKNTLNTTDPTFLSFETDLSSKIEDLEFVFVSIEEFYKMKGNHRPEDFHPGLYSADIKEVFSEIYKKLGSQIEKAAKIESERKTRKIGSVMAVVAIFIGILLILRGALWAKNATFYSTIGIAVEFMGICALIGLLVLVPYEHKEYHEFILNLEMHLDEILGYHNMVKFMDMGLVWSRENNWREIVLLRSTESPEMSHHISA